MSKEHIHHLSQCTIHAGSIEYNRHALTARQKHFKGSRKGLTSCRPSAEVSRAGLPMQRPAHFMLLSDSCVSALRSIFGTLSSPNVSRRKNKTKQFFFSPLPLSKPGVSHAPREVQPGLRGARGPPGGAENAGGPSVPHRYCPFYLNMSRFHGGLD